jgi:hypothetical protein
VVGVIHHNEKFQNFTPIHLSHAKQIAPALSRVERTDPPRGAKSGHVVHAAHDRVMK